MLGIFDRCPKKKMGTDVEPLELGARERGLGALLFWGALALLDLDFSTFTLKLFGTGFV